MPSLRSLLKVAAAPKPQPLVLNNPLKINTVQTVIPQILESLGRPVSFVPELSLLNESEIDQMNFLKHLGSLFKNVLHIGEEAAFIAEPFVALAVPQVAGIFDTTLKTIVGGEGVFTATAKNTSGSGADKAAAALPALLPVFQNWAVANGFDANDPKVKAATQAAIDSAVAFAKSFDNITHATTPVLPAAVVPVKS